MAQEYTHALQADGSLVDRATGQACRLPRLDAHLVLVDHLVPHVISFTMPKGDQIRVVVRYSCHCWSETYEESMHAGQCIFADGAKPRVFNIDRYNRSLALGSLISGAQDHVCMMTPAKRNFMAYNASIKLADGSFYKTFFTIKKERGSVDNIRHSLSIFVESAYCTDAPDEGMNVRFNAIINSVLTDKPLRYKP